MEKDQVVHHSVRPSEITASSGSKFFGAVFMYMFIGLLITFGISAALSFILSEAVFTSSEVAAETFLIVLGIGLLFYIPVLIWVQVSAIRNGKSVKAAFYAYSAVMGILLSSSVAFVPIIDLLAAFGTTCLAFGIMALIAWTSKKDLSFLRLIGSGIIYGVFILFLFNGLMFMFFPGLLDATYTFVSYLIFFAVMIITISDLRRAKDVAEYGVTDKNIALSCALVLYVDFIYIFIRILELVVSIRSKN